MNSDLSVKTEFVNRLTYFGGAITGAPSNVRSSYQDLEQFVVDATNRMSDDIRVTQCFLNWITRYGVLLCPSKLRRLLKSNDYDKAVLGAFLRYLIENDPRPKRWSILKKMAHKKLHRELLFPNFPAPKYLNPHFEANNLITHQMTANPSKYLLPAKAVLKQCPEIANRAMMIGIVASDMLSLVKKEPAIKTAYEIAKKIHHHKAQVYSVVRTMEQVGYRILRPAD